MFDRSRITKAAWSLYRDSAYGRGPFDREAFGRALSMAWTSAKIHAAREQKVAAVAAPEPAPKSARTIEMEARIDTLKYLPAHMSFTRAAAAIRAEYQPHV